MKWPGQNDRVIHEVTQRFKGSKGSFSHLLTPLKMVEKPETLCDQLLNPDFKEFMENSANKCPAGMFKDLAEAVSTVLGQNTQYQQAAVKWKN